MNADVLAELLAEVKLLRKELQVFSAPLVKKAEREFREMKKQAKFEEMMARTDGIPYSGTQICRMSRFLNSKTRKRIMDDLLQRGLIECSTRIEDGRSRKYFSWRGPTPAGVVDMARKLTGN